jgi:hypothetical protein
VRGITWATVKTFWTGTVYLNYAGAGGVWICIGAEQRMTYRVARLIGLTRGGFQLADLRAKHGPEIATSK